MDTNGNYCGLTENSTVPYTDEDLSLAEGLKRIQLAHASKKPWWVYKSNKSSCGAAAKFRLHAHRMLTQKCATATPIRAIGQ